MNFTPPLLDGIVAQAEALSVEPDLALAEPALGVALRLLPLGGRHGVAPTKKVERKEPDVGDQIARLPVGFRAEGVRIPGTMRRLNAWPGAVADRGGKLYARKSSNGKSPNGAPAFLGRNLAHLALQDNEFQSTDAKRHFIFSQVRQAGPAHCIFLKTVATWAHVL